MRVLLAHNVYRQPGGEDAVFAAERALLEAHGDEVVPYVERNDESSGLALLARTVGGSWNHFSYRRMRLILRRERPDVVHFHNTFPLISPSALYAASAEGVPVVQTLHNYRLLCVNALFLRDGRPCEDCLGRTPPWPGVLHGCYRNSRAASAAVAAMLAVHRALGTWRRKVDVFVALSEFARRKLVAGGVPSERIAIKPNFVEPDPGMGEGSGQFALFVGRLSEQKGVEVLLEAWRRPPSGLPLKIVGDGDLRDRVTAASEQSPEIDWLGQRDRREVLELMRQATLLVLPSLSYEGFPMVLAEAQATGLPVVASRLGSLEELVREGSTGLLFEAGDPEALSEAVGRLTADLSRLQAMRNAARREYESRYTAEINYRMLREIYRRAMDSASSRGR